MSWLSTLCNKAKLKIKGWGGKTVAPVKVDPKLPISEELLHPSEALDVLCAVWLDRFVIKTQVKRPLHVPGDAPRITSQGSHLMLVRGDLYYHLCGCPQSNVGAARVDYSGRRPEVDWIDRLYPLTGRQTYELLTDYMSCTHNQFIRSFNQVANDPTDHHSIESYTTTLVFQTGSGKDTKAFVVEYTHADKLISLLGCMMKILTYLEILPTEEMMAVVKQVYAKEELMRRKRELFDLTSP